MRQYLPKDAICLEVFCLNRFPAASHAHHLNKNHRQLRKFVNKQNIHRSANTFFVSLPELETVAGAGAEAGAVAGAGAAA